MLFITSFRARVSTSYIFTFARFHWACLYLAVATATGSNTKRWHHQKVTWFRQWQGLHYNEAKDVTSYNYLGGCSITKPMAGPVPRCSLWPCYMSARSIYMEHTAVYRGLSKTPCWHIAYSQCCERRQGNCLLYRLDERMSWQRRTWCCNGSYT